MSLNIDPLTVKPQLPSGGTQSSTSPGIMTANAVKIVGFTLGAFTLIGFSRVWPTGAVYISLAVLLGVALTHSTQITALVTRYTDALGVSS